MHTWERSDGIKPMRCLLLPGLCTEADAGSEQVGWYAYLTAH